MPSKVSGRRAGYVAAGPCRQCERPQTECGKLSARRLCADCGEANMTRAGRELAAREGAAYEEWRRATIAHARRLAREA